MAHNHQKRVAFVWLGIGLAGLVLIALPALIDMDMMSGGFALRFVGVLAAIVGVLVGGIYLRRAAALGKLLRGEGVLAHWTYRPDEWQRFMAAENVEDRAAKIGLFWVIAGIAVAIGLVFLLVGGEGGRFVFLVMLGLVAVIGFTAFTSIALARKRRERSASEVLIAADAVYINGLYHAWTTLGARLERVNLREKGEPLLELTYSYPTKQGRSRDTVRVPVPEGKEEEARQLLAQLEPGTHSRRRK